VDIEFTVKLVVENAIDHEALCNVFNNDPLEYIRFLVQEEGLLGCTNEDYEIIEARIK
jgi:hypothetical protein